MRRGEPYYPSSPPSHYVTPSHSYHRGYPGGEMPVVYQVYGGQHPSGSGFPGGFSPVRTGSRPYVSPPEVPRSNEDLYASFSPPRRGPPPRHAMNSGGGDPSIFRPKQNSVIVAREPSSNDEGSHYGSKAYSPHQSHSTNHDTIMARSNSSFPTKLHEILSSPEYQDCCAFLPHGRAWRILKPKVFEERVIPTFFRSSKFASFMRQVNGWGFRRITVPGSDFNAYWHPLFLRGLPDLTLKMRRPQKNDPDAKNEEPPDFYRLDKFSPLPGRNGTKGAPPVATSSSMSSVSCEPPGKEHGIPNAHGREADEFAPVSSWDHGDQLSTDGGGVAVNLADVYDKEVEDGCEENEEKSATSHQLSDADINYLVQQNRTLIKEVHNLQSKRYNRSIFRR